MFGENCEEVGLPYWFTIQNFQSQPDQFTSKDSFFPDQ